MSVRGIMRLLPALALAGVTLIATPTAGEAQFGKRLKDAVKRTAEDKAINKATEEESKAIDNARVRRCAGGGPAGRSRVVGGQDRRGSGRGRPRDGRCRRPGRSGQSGKAGRRGLGQFRLQAR